MNDVTNTIDKSQTYYRFNNETKKHYDFTYSDGLNVLNEKLNHGPICKTNGLYFTTKEYISGYSSYGVFLCVVQLPNDLDFECWSEHYEYRANKIYLEHKYDMRNLTDAIFVYENISKLSIDYFASIGNLDMIRWIYDNYPNDFIYTLASIDSAASKGYVYILDWFYDNFPNKFKYTNNSIDMAITNDHINILQWFYDYFPNELKCITYNVNMTIINGHINVLDWFHEHPECKFEYTTNSIDKASANNHVNVLQWFHEHPEHEFKYTTNSIDMAIINGHLNVSQWFHDNFYEFNVKIDEKLKYFI